MSMTDEAPRRRWLQAYVGAIVVATAAVAATLSWAASDRPAPSLPLLGLLAAAAFISGVAKVGLPVRGVGGVREYTSMIEVAAVLVMVFLEPAWAMGVSVAASLLYEGLVHRNGASRMAFNTASEGLGTALGSVVFHEIAGAPFSGDAMAIGVALLAAVIYIAVNNATFLGVVAALSGRRRSVLAGAAFRSSLLLSLGLATTGVLAATLAVEAPWGLPLVVVPAVLSHVQADDRRKSLHLEAAKDAADAANRAKSGFLADMSHEMKTPLGVIIGYGELLELDADLQPSEQHYLDQMMAASHHLTSIIDESLDLSRIEAGQLHLTMKHVDAQALARDSLALIQPLARDRELRTEIVCHGDGLRVSADEQRLRQVLLNLLSNAVKYNVTAGRITVTVEPAGPDVRIAVSDTGSGIAPSDLQRVFVPFERLPSTASAVKGTGLGLSLSLRFVEAMGGRLDVTSGPGVGTTFSVLLPRVDSRGEVGEAAPHPRRDA